MRSCERVPRKIGKGYLHLHPNQQHSSQQPDGERLTEQGQECRVSRMPCRRLRSHTQHGREATGATTASISLLVSARRRR